MKIELLACTDRGLILAERLGEKLRENGHICAVSRSGRALPAADWTAARFDSADALIYIAASGIALRSVAPHIKSKLTDPAVLVIDAAGRYVIPLLSGHVGGANKLAREIASLLSAEAVITTGTDIFGSFSPDEWAAEQKLIIANPDRIVDVAAALIRGENVRLYSDLPISGRPPRNVELILGGQPPDPTDSTAPYIVLSPKKMESARALHLIPPALTLGIGCRRGISSHVIEKVALAVLDENGYDIRAVRRVASIDIKAAEPGLIAFCESYGLDYITYPAADLAVVPGNFSPSDFVKGVTGVDNVCERSAAAGGGALLIKKTAREGVALALAGGDFPLSFEEMMS